MISFLRSLAVGNAVRVILTPPDGAEAVRLLRRADVDFAGHDDPDAAVILTGGATSTVDFETLATGEVYYYRPYYRMGADWTAGEARSVLIEGELKVIGPNPLAIVRARLEDGLRNEVTAGRIVHSSGLVPCLTSPPAYDRTRFPIVTVHLDDDRDQHRALGEMVVEDTRTDAGNWVEGEGWLARYTIKIATWVVGNAEARADLREAVKKVLMGNQPVFRSAGMDQVSFSMTDVEDLESYDAHMFQTLITFTCTAPYVVTGEVDSINDITVSVTGA